MFCVNHIYFIFFFTFMLGICARFVISLGKSWPVGTWNWQGETVQRELLVT